MDVDLLQEQGACHQCGTGLCAVASVQQPSPHCSDTVQTGGSSTGFGVWTEKSKGWAEEGEQYQFFTVSEAVRA